MAAQRVAPGWERDGEAAPAPAPGPVGRAGDPGGWVLQVVDRGRGGRVSPRGGWSRAGSLQPISPGLRLRRLRPRLRPRGGDRGSHHPSRPQDWGLQTPASDPGPTSSSPDPTAPRAAREAVTREDSPAASPLCGRLARTSAGRVGGGSGEGAPHAPEECCGADLAKGSPGSGKSEVVPWRC